MKLDQYIEQTLLDISNGVRAAQKKSVHHIAPLKAAGKNLETSQLVTFDVAVTVNKEAGGGIEVWSFADLKASGKSEQSNRITFSVPIFFQALTSNKV